jgi:hypothetical protein
MPGKSRRAAHGHATHRRRKIARSEPSTSAVTGQSARTAASVQVIKDSVPDVQLAAKQRHVLATDMRRTFILGGILVVALIAFSLVLRYVITIS